MQHFKWALDISKYCRFLNIWFFIVTYWLCGILHPKSCSPCLESGARGKKAYLMLYPMFSHLSIKVARKGTVNGLVQVSLGLTLKTGLASLQATIATLLITPRTFKHVCDFKSYIKGPAVKIIKFYCEQMSSQLLFISTDRS